MIFLLVKGQRWIWRIKFQLLEERFTVLREIVIGNCVLWRIHCEWKGMIFGSLRGETTRTMGRFHAYASNLLSTLPKTNLKRVLHVVGCKRIIYNWLRAIFDEDGLHSFQTCWFNLNKQHFKNRTFKDPTQQWTLAIYWLANLFVFALLSMWSYTNIAW